MNNKDRLPALLFVLGSLSLMSFIFLILIIVEIFKLVI